MNDLFGTASAMTMNAVISACGTWRYELRRIWDDNLPLLVICMLNPSRADATINDPTVLNLIHFARLWGYGGILIVNLFAFRSSSPDEMMRPITALARKTPSTSPTPWNMPAIMAANFWWHGAMVAITRIGLNGSAAGRWERMA